MLPTYVILSQLGIRYSDCPTTEMQKQRLNDCEAIIAAVANGTYNLPSWSNATEWPPPTGLDRRYEQAAIAQAEYAAMLTSGDLSQIHAQVDVLNLLHLELSWSPFIPPTDLDILANSVTSVGLLARELQIGRAHV